MATLATINQLKNFNDGFYGWIELPASKEVRPVRVRYLGSGTYAVIPFVEPSDNRTFAVENYNREWRVWVDHPTDDERQTLLWKSEPATFSKHDVNMLLECMFDATWAAVALKMRGDIEWDDSRDVFEVLSKLAWDYESQHDFHRDEEACLHNTYFDDIDVMAVKVLKENFAREDC